jgi:hypothetical protein
MKDTIRSTKEILSGLKPSCPLWLMNLGSGVYAKLTPMNLRL